MFAGGFNFVQQSRVSRPAPNNSTPSSPKPVPTQPLLRRDTVRGTAVWYRCGQCVVSGGTVTDVDCERGCPPPVRWPTLLHPSFRGPTSPISPPTSPLQQISPPSGPPTLSLRPQATLDSFQGFQVHCLVFWSFFPFNRLKCLKITTTLVTISECLVLVLV